MDLQSIYLTLPVWAQELALSEYARQLERRYYGEKYEAWLEFFRATERLPAGEQRARQLERLREVLLIAFQQVPWYREWAAWRKLRVADFTTLDDLRCLPVVGKDTYRADPWRFVREDYPRRQLWVEGTGGTTGRSFRFYWSREALPRWWALHEARVRHWAGVSQAMPRAMVGGRQILRGGTERPPFWRFNRRWRQLYLSSYHISPATASAYIDALRRYGSTWVTGYPSSIALLGEYLCEHSATLPVRAVVTSGETVSPHQRQAIEQGFNCRLFDYYGSAEGCCVISECEHGRLHLQPEAGILEILDEQENPCPPGVDGEFVCTGLGNDAMPLIRYRMGDYGSWSTETRCPCGRESPLVSHVSGRTDDYLLLPDGRRIGRLSPTMRKATHVQQAQLVQDAPDHAWLLLVPEPAYRDTEGEAVREAIYSRIGDTAIRIDIRAVPELPPTPIGKHVLVRRLADHPAMREAYMALLQ